MAYRVINTKAADEGFARLAMSDPKAFAKAVRLVEELREHPTTGLGHPEPLKGKPENRWSRQITEKHHLVYQIFDNEVLVLILTAYGHYDDK